MSHIYSILINVLLDHKHCIIMSLNVPLLLLDSGFWPGQAGRLRDDGLRGNPVVQSARSNPELDALLTDR